jgi:hypothetical protein
MRRGGGVGGATNRSPPPFRFLEQLNIEEKKEIYHIIILKIKIILKIF